MEIQQQKDVYELAGSLKLKYSHFVRGSYVYQSMKWSNYNVNRLMFVLENPDEANYIRDGHNHFIFKPGWCYLVPAFHPALYTLNENLKFISIHFRLEYFSGNDIVSVIKRNIAMEVPGETAMLDRYFGSGSKLYQAILLDRIVYQVIERCLAEEIGTLDALESKFAPWREVIEYINLHCTAATGVEELAAVAEMSRGAFTRKFSQGIGIPPKKFFNRHLAQRAAELLQQPHLTIREIAQMLKFSSEYAFSRFFKSQLGTAPQFYRNQKKF